MVGGSVAGEITIAGFTVRDKGCVSLAVTLSVAFTVKVAVPAVVGVPLMTPVLLNDMPPGTAPPTNVQMNPGVPPVTLSVRLHNWPTVQACSGLVLIAGAGLMVRVKLAVSLSFKGSVAVTLAGKVPEAVGVPEIPALAPLAGGVIPSPGGRPEAVHA